MPIQVPHVGIRFRDGTVYWKDLEMTDQDYSEPQLNGLEEQKDRFSLTIKAALNLMGKEVSYETVHVLSTNSFAPGLRADEDCMARGLRAGRGQSLRLVADGLGLHVEQLSFPPDAQDEDHAAHNRARVPAICHALDQGLIIVTEGGESIVADARADGTILAATLDGQLGSPIVRVQPCYGLALLDPPQTELSQDESEPAEPLLTEREVDQIVLRRLVHRIRGDSVPYAPEAGGVTYGLAAMDIWIERMGHVPFCSSCGDKSSGCAHDAAVNLRVGASASAGYLRAIAKRLPVADRVHLDAAVTRYERIVKLLAPAVTKGGDESYAQFIGDPVRQLTYANVLRECSAELAAVADEVEKALADIVFYGDPLTRFLTRKITKRPALFGLVYGAGGFAFCFLLAFFTGSALPDPNTQRVEFFEDYVSLFNFGMVLPIATALILYFYAKLASLWTLVDECIVEAKKMSTETYFLRNTRALNSAWLSWTPFGISIFMNVGAAISMQGKWYSVSEGAAFLCFRLFVVANFYVLWSFLLRGFVTVQVIRRLFDSAHTRTVRQPMHPDGAAGLRPVTLVCVAMNYMVFVLCAYAYVTTFAEPSVKEYPWMMILPAIAVYPFILGYLLFAPLMGIHESLKTQKEDALRALNRKFTPKYKDVFSRIDSEGIHLESAQEMATLEGLHRYVSRMPVWPIDIGIAMRLFTGAGLTIALALIVEILKPYLF